MVLKSRYGSSNRLQRVTAAKDLCLLREHVRGRKNEREKLNKGWEEEKEGASRQQRRGEDCEYVCVLS